LDTSEDVAALEDVQHLDRDCGGDRMGMVCAAMREPAYGIIPQVETSPIRWPVPELRPGMSFYASWLDKPGP
jgi:hypothetical protein